jgi:hypothetical protein
MSLFKSPRGRVLQSVRADQLFLYQFQAVDPFAVVRWLRSDQGLNFRTRSRSIAEHCPSAPPVSPHSIARGVVDCGSIEHFDRGCPSGRICRKLLTRFSPERLERR